MSLSPRLSQQRKTSEKVGASATVEPLWKKMETGRVAHALGAVLQPQAAADAKQGTANSLPRLGKKTQFDGFNQEYPPLSHQQ